MMGVELHHFKELNLNGATIVNGFPGIGLVGTIAANYLITEFELDQVAALDSPLFPPISMVYAARPKYPARIYASENPKLVVFLSEFTPLAQVVRPIAYTIILWAKENKCSQIIAPEGVKSQNKLSDPTKINIYGIGSTDRAREKLASKKIKQLETGIISGVSGILLNEGRRLNLDVVSLIIESYSDVLDLPDAAGAAKLIEGISKLMNMKIDVEPLYNQAMSIEQRLKRIREDAKDTEIGKSPYTTMYR